MKNDTSKDTTTDDTSSVHIPNVNELTIYEGGALNRISIDDLKGNEVAIRQLLNTHNLKIKEVHQARGKISDLNAEIEYHRTSPFFSIAAMVVNLLGTIITGLGVNFLSSNPAPAYSLPVVICGGLLVFTGSLIPVLYPVARKYFNKKTPKSD
jgi:hypothetical protein